MRRPADGHVDGRLLAGPQGRAAANREPHRFAHLVLFGRGVIGPGRGIGGVGQEIVAIVLDRHPERPHERRPGELAVRAHRHCDRDQPVDRHPAALADRRCRRRAGSRRRRAPAGRRAPRRSSPGRRARGGRRRHSAGRSPWERPGASANRACSARCRVLAVDRDDDFRPDPVVHHLQFRAAGVTGDVNMRLLLGDDQRAEVRQLVHDPPDRDFVAGDDPRREDHRVAGGQLELVAARRDPAQRRARLALARRWRRPALARAAAASLRRSAPARENPCR